MPALPLSQADKFFDVIQVGHVYIITKGSLKPKKPVSSCPERIA